MENINTKKLLKYLRDNNIVRMYQTTFDKYLDINSLCLITDDEIRLIMCENKYESIVNLYEVLNNVKISENIKKYIYSLEDEEIIKYCLRLSISQEFDDEKDKLDYIKALSESNREVVKYAYGIASSKLYMNTKDGVDYVKMVGKCDEDVLLQLIYLLHSEKYRTDDELFQFVNLVKDVKKDYIAEYMIDLFKNEDTNTERIPLSYISILMSSSGITQAGYVNKILSDEELIKREDISVIALLIAMCDDEDKLYKAFEIIKDRNMIDNEQLVDIIFNIVNDDFINSKVKVKEKHI